MGKGKGRRRREANYLAAHGGGPSQLAAPPATRDVAAVPAKLRRIMNFKASSSTPHQSNLNVRKDGKRSKNDTKDLKKRRQISQEGSKVAKSETQVDFALQETNDGQKTSLGPSGESPPKKKRRKQEDDLYALMDKLKATPIHKGLSERKKRYLEGKKKKKKSGHLTLAESNQPLSQRETIAFGDIVDAPPKLSFPKRGNNISEERIKQRAIEAYRQKKKWISRPGSHRPPLLANANIFSS